METGQFGRLICRKERTDRIRWRKCKATIMENICMDSGAETDTGAAGKEPEMNMITAFTGFAVKMSRGHGLPSEGSADPFYSRENMAHLKRSIHALNEGRGAAHNLVDAGDE